MERRGDGKEAEATRGSSSISAEAYRRSRVNKGLDGDGDGGNEEVMATTVEGLDFNCGRGRGD